MTSGYILAFPLSRFGNNSNNTSDSTQQVFGLDQYIPADKGDVEIQKAIDTIHNALVGSFMRATVHLVGGSTYTNSNGLVLHGNNVNLNGHGAFIDASGLSTSGKALLITNYKGAPTLNRIDEGCLVENFKIEGNSTAGGAGFNTTTGIHCEGTYSALPTLAVTIAANASSFQFSDASNLPSPPFTVKINSEVILVGTLVSTTASNLTRGYAKTTAVSHTSGAQVIALHDVEPLVRNVATHFFNKGVAVGNSAFKTGFERVFSSSNYYAAYVAGTSFAAEGVSFNNCDLYNSSVGLYSLGQIVGVHNTSIDYNNNQVTCASGGRVHFSGHSFMEGNYGQNPGEVTNPVILTGADSMIDFGSGTELVYTGTGGTRYWTNGVYVLGDNSSQFVDGGTVYMNSIGAPSSTPVTKDAFVGTASTTNNTSIGPRVSIRNMRPIKFDKYDLPAVPMMDNVGNLWPNGSGFLYGELINGGKLTFDGTVAITSVTTDSAVNAPSGDHMLKVVGQGNIYIALPIYEPLRIHGWCLGINLANAVGTVKVNEIYTVNSPSWDGSAITYVADSRNQKGAPYTVPNIGVNTWNYVSWKNIKSSPLESRYAQKFKVIHIDTSLLSSGSVDIDQGAFGLL